MAKATTAGRDRPVVGVRELKNQLSGYLERVKAGEEIIVTQHGTPIARLSAVGAETDARQALIDAGIIIPAGQQRRQLPTRRIEMAPGRPLDELVAEQRR